MLQHELLAIPGVADVGSHIGTAPLGEEINGVNFSESWLSLSPGADYPKVLDAGPGGRVVPPGRLQRCPDLPARADRRGADQRHHRRHRGPRLRHRPGRARRAGQPARRGAGPGARADRRPPGRTQLHPPGRRAGQPGRRRPLRADARRDPAGGRDHDGQRADVGDLLRRGADPGHRVEHPGHAAEPRQPPPAADRHPERRPRRARSGRVDHPRAQPEPDPAGEQPALHRGGRQRERPQPELGHRRGQIGASEVPASRRATGTRCWARRPSGPPRSGGC